VSQPDKIRIAIDTRDLFLAKTGIFTVSEEIINGLKKHEDIEVVEISPNQIKPPQGIVGKAFEHLKFFIWKEIQLPYLVRKKRCDVLICLDYVIPYFLPKNIKAFPVFHGCNIWELPEYSNKYWRWGFTKLAISGARKAHKILTVSQFSKERLASLFHFQLDHIQVFPLGSKKSILKKQSLTDLSKFGIFEEDEYLLHVGVLEKRKNLVRLIEAFATLDRPKLKLILVGQKGPKLFLDDYENIIHTIQRLKLETKVLLSGYVTDEDLYTLYSKAKAYVFPSLYEGFGIPVIEAYHFNLPLAASNKGALPEVVGNGGLLFDPTDVSDIASKLEQILDASEVLLENLSKGQLEMIEKYNWDRSIMQLKKLLTSSVYN